MIAVCLQTCKCLFGSIKLLLVLEQIKLVTAGFIIIGRHDTIFAPAISEFLMKQTNFAAQTRILLA